MRNPRSLRVYLAAYDLAVKMHSAAREIDERLNPSLADQLRTAADSVTANIAEGCGHSSRREFARCLQLASASAAEVDHHLHIARDTGAISEALYTELERKNSAVRKMLNNLLKTVRDELTDDDSSTSVAAMQRRRRVKRSG